MIELKQPIDNPLTTWQQVKNLSKIVRSLFTERKKGKK